MLPTILGALGTALRFSKNGHLLAGVSGLALTLGFLAAPALAGTYHATDATTLYNAINAANGDVDPTATVVFDNDITAPGSVLPGTTKPIIIDTNGHTYSRPWFDNTGGVNGMMSLNGTPIGSNYIFKGNYVGGSIGAGGNGNGDPVLYTNMGKTIENDGTMTGGDGGGLGGSGGNGVGLSQVSTFTNNGTVTGGNAVNGSGGFGVIGSLGASVINSGTITGGNGSVNGGAGVRSGGSPTVPSGVTNSGTIKGGNSTTGAGGDGITFTPGRNTLTNTGTIIGGDGINGGWGVNFTGLTTFGVLNNSGTIKGGNGSAPGGGTSGAGVIVHAGLGTFINSGTITGGIGAAAIANAGGNISLVNSGTLNAGAAYDTAILMQGAQTLTLELHNGSVINGKVVGNSGAANALILGGDDNASFDVSTVGPQYQNFSAYQKTGNSTWTLTGTGSVATPWLISQGTLQVGDGTATGSILGDVTDNASLVFNRSGTVTMSGAISGTGTVTQAGSGTTTLSGANSYAGGTFLNAGTLSVSNETNLGDPAGGLTFNGGILQITGGMTGMSRTITWGANGGGFDIADAGNVFTVGQALAGGQLTKLGAGNLALTADNSYSGGTTIAAGTLQLGNGGTTGSITGDVTDNGVLAFDRSDAVTFAGVISGTGAVSQIGTGTTSLTSINTYAAGTTISAGTLVGSATSFGTGAILDNAALVIDQPVDGAFANTLNGTGSFAKRGAGRLNLTGTGTLSGPTTVTAGRLSVNGSIAASVVTVQSGGTLGGNGTVGATTILSGGAIAPGNSIGTLHINGAFAQNAGSIYQVEVNPASNASDLVLVNGAATIANGATMNVTKNPAGDYRVDAQYTVLTASGGVAGSYALTGQTALSQYLALQEQQDASNVYLRVVQTSDPASAATTPNQTATATATDSLPATGGVGSAVLNTPDTATTRAAFDALSGDALASAKGVLISASVLVRDTTFDRLRDVLCTDSGQDSQTRRAGCVASDDKPSLWVQGFGDWGHVYGTANAAGVSQTTGGFLTGVDIPVSDWRLGIFGGYSRTDFNAATRASSGASDTYHLGAYGGTLLGDVRLRVGASYSWSGIDTERLVAFNAFTNDLRASYNAGTTQVFGEIGRVFQVNRISLEPFANLAYVGIHTKGFSETGGDAALTSRPDTTQDIFATFGVRPSTEIAIGSLSAVLRGMAGWRHTFGNITPSSLVSFAGSTAFTVTGAPIAKEAGVAEAGVSANLSDSAAIGLTYGGQFSNRETDHSIRGTLAITF
jgi:outer membrane autotransporter protein